MTQITTYRIHAPITLRIAVVADLHNHPTGEVLKAVREIQPDFIAVPGDFIHYRYENFFRQLTEIAPAFVSFGNHELPNRQSIVRELRKTNAVLLDNQSTAFRNILIGGLTEKSSLKWLEGFCAFEGYKILLCHHPEYFKFLKSKNIDLILSGHAHGGKIRICGRGLFAPGQGIFPKYTCGLYDEKLLVSRGIANMVKIPRLFNPGEVLCVELTMHNLGM